VLGGVSSASLRVTGAYLKSIYSAPEILQYEASLRESARISTLEEEAKLVLDDFSKLEDALVEALLLIARDVLNSDGKDHAPPANGAVQVIKLLEYSSGYYFPQRSFIPSSK
jgi:hypothetical protein